MPNPQIVNIPEWTWVKVATTIKCVVINRKKSEVYYYKTYRLTGEAAPAVPTQGTIPQEAIRIFDLNNEERVDSSQPIDVYVMCRNGDEDNTDTGRISVGPEKNDFDVNLQDQHTPTIIANFNKVENSTELAAPASREDTDVVVVDATGIAIGKYIILFNPSTERFYFGTAINVVSTTITLDTPLDADFPAGTFLDSAITDMAVNGSVTPQIFGLRGTGAPPGVDLIADITRIIFTCVAADPISLSLFADITALSNGLILRQRNSTWFNVFNVKSNRELAALMFDFTPAVATNPAQGENGFVCRLTFAGQSKIGVTKRLPIGDDLEFIVQDNLSGITSLHCIAEGHIVEP